MEKSDDKKRCFGDKKCNKISVFVTLVIICLCVLFGFEIKHYFDIQNIQTTIEHEILSNHTKEQAQDISKLEKKHTEDISQLLGKIRALAEKLDKLEGQKNSQQADLNNFRGRIENLENNVHDKQHTQNRSNSTVTIQQSVWNLVSLAVLVLYMYNFVH